MLQNKSIAFKLIFFILLASLAIFTAMFVYNYWMSRKIVLKKVRENAATLTAATVHQIEAVLTAAERPPKNIATFLETWDFNERDMIALLKNMVQNTPEIYGGAIAFEPHAYKSSQLYYAPYFYKNGDSLKFTWLGGENYQYHLLDWYLIPRILGKALWSEPYYDEGAGNTVMTTFSVPFYRTVEGRRTFMGVVTADVSLDWLQKLVADIRIYDSGYGFLISQNGSWVTHPMKELVMNETIFGTAEWRNDEVIRKAGKGMLRGESDFIQTRSLITGKKHWVYYMPLRSNGWSLGITVPENELMADLNLLIRNLFILAVLGAVVMFIGTAFIAHSITRPLRALARVTTRLATGDLEAIIPGVQRGDEIGELAYAFQNMTRSLQIYIRNLTETTAAKEKIENELRIAHDIQISILPKLFPPFPDKKELDIYAILQPAREVGGDFYDFYFIDDRHLCFTIGDVSGKGVPASLLMAVTTTLLKAKAVPGATPELIFNKVNNDLCAEEQNNMFVTAFLGILDIVTGELAYSNAGHNLPYLRLSDGSIRQLEKEKTIVLGILKNFTFRPQSICLQPGEAIFLYTDGITEAMNPSFELFNEKRLEEILHQHSDRSSQELTLKLVEAVHEYAQGAPQSDDITFVALRWNGPGESLRG